MPQSGSCNINGIQNKSEIVIKGSNFSPTVYTQQEKSPKINTPPPPKKTKIRRLRKQMDFEMNRRKYLLAKGSRGDESSWVS